MQRVNHNDNDDNSMMAIKVVMIISLVLISMDILEVYFSFANLKIASEKFGLDIFENCIKYHIISQMVFTLFATFAGISAFIFSLFLLLDSELFITKMYKSFLHWNHLIFGPYLLTVSVLGFVYFNQICYNCDPNDLSRKYINVSTIMSLAICFLVSSLISITFSFCYATRKILLSIRFRPGGWRFLGRYFWNYIRNHNNDNNNNNNNQVNNRDNPIVRNVPLGIIDERHYENMNHSVNLNEERRKRAEENIRKRMIEEEQKESENKRIAFNQYTIKRLDDTGSFEDMELVEENKNEEQKNDNNQ